MTIPQVRMTNKAREAAKSLAIAYHAYMGEVTRDTADTPQREAQRLNGIVVWGRKLQQAQAQVGVELQVGGYVSERMLLAKTALAGMNPEDHNKRMANIIRGTRHELAMRQQG